MNLFILHEDPVIAAHMNCDRHVCKIILEAAQMLGLAHYATGGANVPIYEAKTHRNNHVSKWVRETTGNYKWTCDHAFGLLDEFKSRYGHPHKYESIIQWFADNVPSIPDAPRTAFRQAVDPECYDDDAVVAYRKYYKKCKAYFAKWKTGNIPGWYQ